jgi:hypothetical protein
MHGAVTGSRSTLEKDARHLVRQAHVKALNYKESARCLRIRLRRAAAEGCRFPCPSVSSSPFTCCLQPQAWSFLAAAPTAVLNYPSDPAPLRTWSMLSHGIENEMFVRNGSTKCMASFLVPAHAGEYLRADGRSPP